MSSSSLLSLGSPKNGKRRLRGSGGFWGDRPLEDVYSGMFMVLPGILITGVSKHLQRPRDHE